MTDRAWLKEKSLVEEIEKAITSGVTFVQLREKNMPLTECITEAKQIKTLTDTYHIPFVINDNIDVAMEIDADGVHVGQNDMHAREVRKRIGENKILGVSAQTVEQAVTAEKCGADYLGVGAVFSTQTKLDADKISFDTLKAITKMVTIPVVAIGGIDENNILQLKGSDIDGVAVVSAIFDRPDICLATRNLKRIAEEMIDNA